MTHPINTPTPRADFARNRLRLVVVCRKVSDGRAFLREMGMPLPRPTPAPADGHFSWTAWWLFGYPMPYLVVDRHFEPEDVRGADVAVLVERVSPGGPLWGRAVGRHPEGLAQHLREGAAADEWQPRWWQPAAG